jgi:polysaccharide biosynthesis protein PslG
MTKAFVSLCLFLAFLLPYPASQGFLPASLFAANRKFFSEPINRSALSAKPGDAGLPSGAFRNHIGLNEGLAWNESMLQACGDIGIKILRKDLGWKEIEPVKGKYDWADTDKYIAGCEKRGIKVLLILGKTNKLYDTSPTIALPGNALWEPYAAYVKASVERYKDKNVMWELWNEPNVSHMHADMTPVQFILHSLGVMKIIRSVDPDATIVGPATGSGLRLEEDSWGNQLLRNLQRMGKRDEFWQNLNAWTGHHYTPVAPDNLMMDGREMYAVQRAVLDANGGAGVPYCTGERGFTANPKPSQAYAFAGNENRRISYYLRQCLWGIYKEPKGFIINYVTHDIYNSGKEIIGNQAGNAIKTMLEVLGDFEFKERIHLKDEQIVLLKFTRGSEARYAVWDRGNQRQVLNLPVYADKTTLVTTGGQYKSLQNKEYLPEVEVSGSPVYLIPHQPMPTKQ